MVGVNRHALIVDLDDFGHKTVVFIVCQGDDRTLVDILAVKLAVHHEDVALQCVHALWLVFAECLFWLQAEVEGSALLYIEKLLFEAVEGNAEAGDKLKRALVACLLFQILLAVFCDGI